MKRATAKNTDTLMSTVISIHALVKRATVTDYVFQTATRDFNPRPREEGDQVNTKTLKRHHISIHALVKRATKAPLPRGCVPCDFNPRPREEGDAKAN